MFQDGQNDVESLEQIDDSAYQLKITLKEENDYDRLRRTIQTCFKQVMKYQFTDMTSKLRLNRFKRGFLSRKVPIRLKYGYIHCVI